MGDQLQQAASQPDVFLLYEGGEVVEELRRSLTHVRVAPHVKKIPDRAFRGSDTLIDLQLWVIAAELCSSPQNRYFGFDRYSAHFCQSDRGALVGFTRTSVVELNFASAPRSDVAFLASFRFPKKGLIRAAPAEELTPWQEGRLSRPPTATAALTGSRSSSL
ncbi:hypothetical protein THAOC_17656 [Thalassiosira oceanica]|uniref:Uncharacterized protein n=1 Tax=Thalassiosira oceanica TaxID=159749 RepID=K0SU81_THAOC|nr:hypothetical protein THAOC_17656 [Thalassiosira oceanica]|eukprot:EJK61792.1 hypothetical protein THAOC_17656 [Thalassiosira oceanica]